MPKFLFGRKVKLTVTAEGADTVVLDGFDAEKNAGFDIDAHIIKSAEHDANKSVVRVFNLPDNLRKAFQGKSVKCAVEAGHKLAGNVASLGIFDVKRVWSELEEADWVTHLEGGEAHNALFDADVSYSFSAGQTYGFVAKQIVQPLFDAGIGRGNFDRTLGASQLTFPNGACGEGKASDRLHSMARKAGFEFSVQNGAFLFVKLGEANKAMIVNLSPSTGLIGVPAWGEADPKAGNKPQIKVKALLQPQVIPHCLINLTLPAEFKLQGQMKVNKVDQNISTYAQPFYSEMECELT